MRLNRTNKKLILPTPTKQILLPTQARNVASKPALNGLAVVKSRGGVNIPLWSRWTNAGMMSTFTTIDAGVGGTSGAFAIGEPRKQAVEISPGKVVCAYRTADASSNCYIVCINLNTGSVGTPVNIGHTNARFQVVACGTDAFVIAGDDGTGSGIALKAGTVSGTTITLGTFNTIPVINTGGRYDIVAYSATQILCVLYDQTGPQWSVRLATRSGTTITYEALTATGILASANTPVSIGVFGTRVCVVASKADHTIHVATATISGNSVGAFSAFTQIYASGSTISIPPEFGVNTGDGRLLIAWREATPAHLMACIDFTGTPVMGAAAVLNVGTVARIYPITLSPLGATSGGLATMGATGITASCGFSVSGTTISVSPQVDISAKIPGLTAFRSNGASCGATVNGQPRIFYSFSEDITGVPYPLRYSLITAP